MKYSDMLQYYVTTYMLFVLLMTLHKMDKAKQKSIKTLQRQEYKSSSTGIQFI